METKFGVCSPVGGFGNHTRWLLWCNDSTRLEFIKEKVYPNDRTWHNWLDYEWKHRENLDQQILFRHKIIDINDVKLPTIILTISPELSLRNYLKFNPNLGMATTESFCKSIQENNRHNQKFSTDRCCLLLSADVLWAPILDKNFYQLIIDFVEIAPNYLLAQEVHKLWWQAQQRSEQQIVEFLTHFYRPK